MDIQYDPSKGSPFVHAADLFADILDSDLWLGYNDMEREIFSKEMMGYFTRQKDKLVLQRSHKDIGLKVEQPDFFEDMPHDHTD